MALARGYPFVDTEAKGVAAALGFVKGSGDTTVTVNNPPLSGSYTRNSGTIEVIITQPQTLKLAGLLGVSLYNLTARAVAVAGSAGRLLHAVHGSNRGGWGWFVGRRNGHDERVRNGR